MSINRINWIDWAKAIAIYAVVFGHTTNQGNASETINSLAEIGRSFHVALFFFISGYLFRVKTNSIVSFCKKEIKSLIIPYLFFNLVSAAILWKFQSKETYIDGLYGFLCAKGNAFAGPAWFLVTLMWIQLFEFYLRKIENHNIKILIVVAILCATIFLPIKIPFGISSSLVGIVFFEFGILSKSYDVIGKYMEWSLTLKTITAIVLIGLTYFGIKLGLSIDIGNAQFASSPIFCYLHAIVAVFMALSVCGLLGTVESKFIRKASSSSIVIMGFHMTIVQIIWAYGGKLPSFMQFLFHSPGISITSFLLSIVVALFLSRYAPSMIGNRK